MTKRAAPIEGRDPIDIEIGLAVRRRRNAAAITPVELARVLGFSYQQLGKYERGQNRMPASTLVHIARALRARPADLLPQIDAPPLPPAAALLAVRGADKLLEAYAAIPVQSQRRAVLEIARALGPWSVDDPSRGASD